MSYALLESLFEGDLEGMIEPVLSIDDFESKIDSNVIVLAFYVKNENAAEDLAVFLERSNNENILDTEVSLTPNKDGEFLVFIELDIKQHDIDTIFKNIQKIIELTMILTGKLKWRIKNNRILKNKLYKYNEQNIKALVERVLREL